MVRQLSVNICHAGHRLSLSAAIVGIVRRRTCEASPTTTKSSTVRRSLHGLHVNALFARLN